LVKRYPAHSTIRGAALLRAAVVCSLPVLWGCASSAPPPPSAPAPPAPVKIEAAPDARALATEHFYRGKAFALSGDAACARIEFDEALETFRKYSKASDLEDLNFAQQLWDSISLYRTITEGRADPEDRPPAEETPDSLIAVSPAPSPDEVERVKAELSPGEARTFDIPVVVNDDVLRAIAFYQFRTPQAFAGALKRSGRYLPMMRSILVEHGLPQDLVYVAMIESAFKPVAHSRKGAHGFWQFIEGTGKRYGLKRTRAVDERSDPVKSTHAAAAYFKDLYEMFGDWHLAMAGYDAGEGKIIKGLQRTGARDYWELASGGFLQRETRDYVPFVLAAALIAKDPARYGFDIVPDPPMEFEIVQLEKSLDLARAADKIGVSVDDLRLLNGELRTRLTPAGGVYPLRVPPGTGEILKASLNALPAAAPVEERKVKVKKGDTLPRLAARYKVSVADLADWNDLPANARLKPGTVLTVPSRPAPSPAPAGRSSAARKGAGAPPPQGQIRALPTPAAAVSDPKSLGVTEVRVAQGANAAPAAPPASRALPSTVDIPAEGFTEDAAPEKAGASAKGSSKKGQTYTVRKGDTLYKISTRFGVTIDGLRKQNKLKPGDPLPVGRRLVIPGRPGR
jgi:membrane-bound lytic murein transglycosylase D